MYTKITYMDEPFAGETIRIKDMHASLRDLHKILRCSADEQRQVEQSISTSHKTYDWLGDGDATEMVNHEGLVQLLTSLKGGDRRRTFIGGPGIQLARILAAPEPSSMQLAGRYASMNAIDVEEETQVDETNKRQKVMIPEFENADRTLVITNGAGNDNNFDSHWPYEFTESEKDILEELFQKHKAWDTMIITYLYMIRKNQTYTFSTVKDMEMALEMYENDWRNEDDRSSYNSVVYKLQDLQKHETYLLGLMTEDPDAQCKCQH